MPVSEPRHEMQGGVHLLTWKDEHIQMVVTRLYETSHYEIHADIEITTTRPGYKPHLYEGRENLRSLTTRRTLIKHLLHAKGNQEYDPSAFPNWELLIEDAFTRVVSKSREGEKPKWVKDILPSESLKHRVNPFLLEKRANLFFGAPKSGKSFFALYLAVLMTLPLDGITEGVEPCSVLYLDYEDEADTLRERQQAIVKGLGDFLDDMNILYRRCWQPIAGDITAIQAMILEHNISTVIIDSAAKACGGDPLSLPLTMSYFIALRSLNITTLTIHHQPKNIPSEKETPYGNQYWISEPRSIFHFVATQELNGDTLNVGIFDKAGNHRKQLYPIGVEISFPSDDVVTFVRTRVSDDAALSQRLPMRDRIEALLRQGTMMLPEMAELLVTSEAQLRARLNEPEGKQRFVRLPDGSWGNRALENTV